MLAATAEDGVTKYFCNALCFDVSLSVIASLARYVELDIN